MQNDEEKISVSYICDGKKPCRYSIGCFMNDMRPGDKSCHRYSVTVTDVKFLKEDPSMNPDRYDRIIGGCLIKYIEKEQTK